MHCPFACLIPSLLNSHSTIVFAYLLSLNLTHYYRFTHSPSFSPPKWDSCDWSDSLSEFCYSKPLALLIFHAIGACRSLLDSRVLKGFQVHFISGARSFSASLWEPGKGKWVGYEAGHSRLPAPLWRSCYLFYMLGFFISFCQYKEFNWFWRVWKRLALKEVCKGSQTRLEGQDLSLWQERKYLSSLIIILAQLTSQAHCGIETPLLA